VIAVAGKSVAYVSVDIDTVDSHLAGYGIARPPCDRVYRACVPRLLELLDRLGIRATLFVIARDAEAQARLWREASALGHEIASHSLTHPMPFASLSRSDLDREIRDSRERLEQVVGEPVLGFRAPGWDVSAGTLEAVVRAGYRYDASLVPSPVFVASPIVRFVLSLGAARGLGLRRALRGAFGKRTPHLTGPGRALVEFPAAVSPVMRLPFTHTLWYLAPANACWRTFRTIHRSGVPLSYSFHAVDLLGLEEDGVDRRMSRHPGMRWPLRPKLRLLEDVLREIVSRYQVTTYAKSLNGGAVTSWRAEQP
jgi:peptidoglycan/xylan/chitin deacetylase (PgdA/CDA1 family)